MCFNSALASLVVIPVAIPNSEITIKIFIITAEIKMYGSIVQKKKHDKIVLLAKTTIKYNL